MAKLSREHKLRERRLNKEAKKAARKQAPSDSLDPVDRAPEVAAAAEAVQPDAGQAGPEAAVQPLAEA